MRLVAQSPAPTYLKNHKILTHGCNYPKIRTMWLYYRAMHPKDADGVANSLDLISLNWVCTVCQSSLIWVCTVCQDLFILKLRIITVPTDSNVFWKIRRKIVKKNYYHLCMANSWNLKKKSQGENGVCFVKIMKTISMLPLLALQPKMSQLMRLWYLLHRRPAKAQVSLRIRAVLPEPSLITHVKYRSRQKI